MGALAPNSVGIGAFVFALVPAEIPHDDHMTRPVAVLLLLQRHTEKVNSILFWLEWRGVGAVLKSFG